jgi:hypothetical protein
VPVNDRIYPVCNNDFKSELPVILECPLYNDVRLRLFEQITAIKNGTLCITKDEQLKMILAHQHDILVQECAKVCNSILSLRRLHLYV